MQRPGSNPALLKVGMRPISCFMGLHLHSLLLIASNQLRLL